ncbi:MAG TPA: lysoplasmalogenase [Candidatus Hydrogenedentes bacterium]|jgi:uncharacterized membrane protein YhhN|nr:lysoplasmalogenase [Candidatus Hydrogenedentota bacterium]HPJ99514.1 lysoplasmalogenase [Candidatus Hydrogenedentota bacterium]
MRIRPQTRATLTGLQVLFTCSSIGSCAGMLLAYQAGNPELARALRIIACLSPVLLALVCGAHATWYGRWLFLGLLCCWLGDRLLGTYGFLPGLLAFLLGHMAFAIASLARGISLKPFAVASGVLTLAAGAVLLWLYERVPPERVAPVLAYLFVISLMAAFASGASWRHRAPLLAIAASVFYVSDLFVARGMFVQYDYLNSVVGLPLYFGSLVLFALSIPGATGKGSRGPLPRVVECCEEHDAIHEPEVP